MPWNGLGPRIGSLFSGYGGLDMGVQAVIGGTVEWVADIEPAACRVLAAHHPGVPNLGDVTAVDWATVPPIDVLTGGYPCQPFSHAGNRKGHNDARHLWPTVATAIRHLVPSLVVLENVRGHYSLGFGTVIGDLAGMGYDARWGCVRASDVGAPHQRARVFVVAYPRGTGLEGHDLAAVPSGRQGRRGADRPAAQGDQLSTADAEGNGQREQAESRVWAEPGFRAGNPAPDPTCERIRPFGPDHGQSPRADWSSGSGQLDIDWRQYAPAIARWERITRPAPAPTVPGLNGRHRLSPRFTEWMMGLPEGHVTGHGLSAKDALRLCGNGVVPQQAAHALRLLGVGA